MKPRYYYLLVFPIIVVAAFFFVIGQDKPETNKFFKSAPDEPEDSPPAKNSTFDSAKSISDRDPDWLLPDLKAQALSNAYIVSNANDKKILRFQGTFMNVGDGPLELAGSPDAETGTTLATQRVYKKSGAPKEMLIGNFIFHPTHNHWHFENFVEFEILSLKNKRELDKTLVSTGKMTFCLHDYAPLDKTFPGKPEEAVYPWCDSSADIQGISTGWVDTYNAEIPGQELDISNIPDGIYAFRSVVDPENRILEKNENNNFSVSFIEIAKNNVSIIPAPSS